jgi:hypothetical protein
MADSLKMSRKFPVVVKSIQLHNVSIRWDDASVYDHRRNFNCTQMITVVLNTQDTNREFYVILYEWLYDRDNPEDHPFCHDQILLRDTSSVVRLWRTKESDSLVKYLVMDDTDLITYSGISGVSRFRRDILIAIELFEEEGGKVCDSGAIWEDQSRFRIYHGDGTDPLGLGGHGWVVR